MRTEEVQWNPTKYGGWLLPTQGQTGSGPWDQSAKDLKCCIINDCLIEQFLASKIDVWVVTILNWYDIEQNITSIAICLYNNATLC